SVRDWEKEFSAFGAILKNVGPNNGLAESKFAFSIAEVIGFRAPYLATGAGLSGALKAHGFRYDTSGVSVANAWPEKVDGVWRFNLAMLRIQGSGKGTLSMEYNFFVAQSRAVRSASVRGGAGTDAANLSALLQDQLRRKPRAAAHRASFHELRGRRLQRGAQVIRARGLWPAGSALRDLCQALRLHGSAERGDARGLSQRRFRARG